MSKKFKRKKHLILGSAMKSKKLTPRDCRRLQIPLDQADRWEVVKRDPATGIAQHVQSTERVTRDADGNVLLPASS